MLHRLQNALRTGDQRKPELYRARYRVAKDEIESNRFGPRSYYYDRRYFYLDDDIETEERFILRLTIKDKAEDKSLWTGFTSWNQNRLNDSSDTETIQALVNSLLLEL